MAPLKTDNGDGVEDVINLVESLTEESDDIQNSYKIHLKIIAILLLLYSTVTTGSIVILFSFKENDQLVDCNTKLIASFPLHNNTECSEYHKFPLTDELYVIVCIRKGPIVLEINKFESAERSSNGIQMNSDQWLYLKHSIAHIDNAIVELQRIQSLS